MRGFVDGVAVVASSAALVSADTHQTPTHILVLGSARPLLEAFQLATAELQRWLQADYGFTERGAQAFMGQATEYEIANVVDPSFTVVAKVAKALLPKR